jgi:hypothetical protein
VNRHWTEEREVRLDLGELRGEPRLHRPWQADTLAGTPAPETLHLAPAEVALVAEPA